MTASEDMAPASADRWRCKILQDILSARDEAEKFTKHAHWLLSVLHDDLAYVKGNGDDAHSTDQQILQHINGLSETHKAWQQNFKVSRLLLDSIAFHVRKFKSLGVQNVMENQGAKGVDNRSLWNQRRMETFSLNDDKFCRHEEHYKVDNTNHPNSTLHDNNKRNECTNRDFVNNQVNCKDEYNETVTSDSFPCCSDVTSNVHCILAAGEFEDCRFSSSAYIIMQSPHDQQGDSAEEHNVRARMVNTLHENLQQLAKNQDLLRDVRDARSIGDFPLGNWQKSENEASDLISSVFNNMHLTRSFYVKSSPVASQGESEVKLSGSEISTTSHTSETFTRRIASVKDLPYMDNSVRADQNTGFISQKKPPSIEADFLELARHGLSKKTLASITKAQQLLEEIRFDEMIRKDKRNYETNVLIQKGSHIPIMYEMATTDHRNWVKQQKIIVPAESYFSRIPGPQNGHRKWLIEIE